MSNYGYLFVGLIMGIAVSIYYYASREERIEKEIEMNKKVFSTKLLDLALEKAITKMKNLIDEKSRELSEDEKNEIIFNCLSEEKNNLNNENKKLNENC